MLRLLLVACVFVFTNADWIDCPYPINIPIDANYVWPSFLHIGPNQHCTFEMSYRNSSFINIVFSGQNFTNGDTVYLHDPYGNRFEWTTTFNMMTTLPPPSITIEVITGPASQITFDLQISTTEFSLNNVENTVNIETGPSMPPTILSQFEMNTTYVIKSNTEVAVSFAGNSQLPWQNQQYLAIFVYDGTGPTAKLIGTVYNTNKQTIVSTTGSMTLYSMTDMNNMLVLVNDNSNLEKFSSYQTAMIPHSGGYVATLDASDGPAAISIGYFDYSESGTYLNSIDISDPSATFSAFAGAPTSIEGMQLARYDCQSIGSSLPQWFPQTLTTFVLDKGTANLSFYGTQGAWSSVKAGREGFLFSRHYPFQAANQTMSTFLRADLNQMLNFEFKLLHFDQEVTSKNDVLFIAVTDANQEKIPYSYALRSLNNTTIAHVGTLVEIYINPSSSTTKAYAGSMFSFKVTESDNVPSSFTTEISPNSAKTSNGNSLPSVSLPKLP